MRARAASGPSLPGRVALGICAIAAGCGIGGQASAQTSYVAGEKGAYEMQMDVGEGASLPAIAEHRGTLEYGDSTLGSGEYSDEYEFSGYPGQRVRIDVRSNDFDTYVILVPPTGRQIENDDGESTSHSRIEEDISELGTYRVYVTSYEAGETGDYVLTIDQFDPSLGRAREDRDVVGLTLGRRASGVLEAGDRRLEDGGYRDDYVFDGDAGQTVRVEMSSRDFDTYVALITPAGQSIQNDDYDGDTRRSLVEMTLPETGRYRIVATSYGEGETGSYEVVVRAVQVTERALNRHKHGRTYGIFAGIADYPGDDRDLLYTADDALRLRDALASGAGMSLDDQIVLTNQDATISALRLAVHDIERRARPEDTFVFFFSGHGDRVERADGPQSTDPDALDETIELFDGAISDDELSELFGDLRAGVSLIFIDACYSGGFAKDMISVPGRMGMFSSEEDVTSSVASKFRAGGYLSVFLSDAIGRKLADTDGDGAVSAIELSQYVYDRYRADVKTGASSLVRMRGPRMGQQHLVVDRGSIGPYQVLFE